METTNYCDKIHSCGGVLRVGSAILFHYLTLLELEFKFYVEINSKK